MFLNDPKKLGVKYEKDINFIFNRTLLIGGIVKEIKKEIKLFSLFFLRKQ